MSDQILHEFVSVVRPQTPCDLASSSRDRGGCFYDGLTSMLSWEMMEMGQRAGRMELKGEEGAIGGKVISGDLRFGGVTRSHVGFAQTRGEEICHLMLGIPNLLVPPIITALSMETAWHLPTGETYAEAIARLAKLNKAHRDVDPYERRRFNVKIVGGRGGSWGPYRNDGETRERRGR